MNKPCPFCGSTRIDNWGSLNHSGPLCEDCLGNSDTPEGWNRRPEEERLRFALKQIVDLEQLCDRDTCGGAMLRIARAALDA